MKPGSRVGDDAHGELGRDRSALSRFAMHGSERVALDPLHGHEQNSAILTDLVNADDVRMIDGADDLPLFEEHGAKLRSLRELGQHGFHGHESVAHVARLASHPYG